MEKRRPTIEEQGQRRLEEMAPAGGLVPAFAGKVGKPVRVAKANTGGQTMRDDSALGQPLDARATNLLSTDTGGDACDREGDTRADSRQQ